MTSFKFSVVGPKKGKSDKFILVTSERQVKVLNQTFENRSPIFFLVRFKKLKYVADN